MNRPSSPRAVVERDPAFSGNPTDREIDPEDPAHRGSTDVHKMLDEAGVVGGADNTAEPAGANFSHEEEEDQLDETVRSKSAKVHYKATRG